MPDTSLVPPCLPASLPPSTLPSLQGEGATSLPRDASNLVVSGCRLAFVEAGWADMPPLHFHLLNRIPIGAGLGSSSAAIVSGLLAGLTLLGTTLPVEGQEKALQLAATVEGHVDNLAPCIYGGLQVGVHTGSRWYTSSVNVPSGLQCILYIPDARQDTEGARAILPKVVPRADAVFNIGRVGLLINAFASGQLDDLALATEDALHQPARAKIMPALLPVVRAAKAAGAKGAFLSGAGSSIMAITTGRKGDVHGQRPQERRDIDVARAMARAAAAVGQTGRILMTQPSQIGAHVAAIDGDSSAVVSGHGIGLDFTFSAEELAAAKAVCDAAAAEDAAKEAAAAAAEGGGEHGAHGSAAPAVPSLSLSASLVGPAHASVTYVSTRAVSGPGSPSAPISFLQALYTGLAPDGGLYVPAAIPQLDPTVLGSKAWRALPYYAVAARVLALYLGPDVLSFTALVDLCKGAYGDGTSVGGTSGWDTPAVAPVIKVPFLPADGQGAAPGSSVYVAEHFHGPTCAFKDLALQLLGPLFERFLGCTDGSGYKAPSRLTVLGATSGDTGSAAIAGLRGKKGVEVYILHPAGRVARVQELQMTTVLDSNVHNVAVGGGATFDDCQAHVKACFSDAAFNGRHGGLSAINSINWARVLAQTCYYAWTYTRWLEEWETTRAQGGHAADARSGALPTATFVVPTGNFGNALAAHYARAMGVPLAPICIATNSNDILHRFVSGGDYSVLKGGAVATLAPSMDIQVSSNLERYWHSASGSGGGVGAAQAVRAWTSQLSGPGKAVDTFTSALVQAARADFTSASADDATIDAVITRYLTGAAYALCPHTACGFHALDAVPGLAASVAEGRVVVMATAHPAKFAEATPALAATGLYVAGIEGREEPEGSRHTQPALPAQLKGLGGRPKQMGSVTNNLAAVQAYVDAIAAVRQAGQ